MCGPLGRIPLVLKRLRVIMYTAGMARVGLLHNICGESSDCIDAGLIHVLFKVISR